MSTRADISVTPPAPPVAESAKERADNVRRRLLQAQDALAVAHLLLGVNASVRSVGTGGERT